MKHFNITAPTPGQGRADTAGWDAVSCVKIGQINDAIRNAGTSPRELDVTCGRDCQVKGTFVHWRVAPGGSGPLLNLVVPVRDVEVSRGDRTVTLEEIHAYVQVQLELIPSNRKRLGANPDTVEKLLVIKLDDNEGRMQVGSKPRAAQLMDITGADDLSPRLLTALRLGLMTWFNDNLDAFAHVFATVNVSTKIAEETEGEAFAWLAPTDVSYAYGHNAIDDEESVLAILCQTQGRSKDGLVNEANPALIPPGCDAGLCISRTRFLRNMIGESLPSAFKGIQPKHIKYKKRDAGLKLTKAVQTEQIEHDGKTYDPVVHRLDIDLHDRELVIDSLTKTEVSPGIFSVCKSTGYYGFGLIDRKDGGKTMGVTETRPMTTVESTEKTKAVKITDIVLGILGAIGSLILGAVTFGAGSVVFYVVLAIVVGSLAGTIGIKLVEMVGEGNAPPIDLMLANATSAVTWSTGATFVPTFAALNNGLQIGGSLSPVKPGLLGADASLTAPDYHKAFQAEFADVMAARAKS